MLDWLNNFLLNTPASIIKEKWDILDKDFPTGISAFEYLELSRNQYTEIYSPPDGEDLIINCKEMTSEFSGVFFFANLVTWKK